MAAAYAPGNPFANQPVGWYLDGMSTETILDVRAVLDAYFAGINSERYEDVAALFAADGELVAPGVKPRRGPDAIARYFTLVLARYPVHHDQPVRTFVDGSTATVEIAFTGELASGAPMVFDAVDVFDLDAHGRIAKLVTWYDSHLVRVRLTDAEARDDAGARVRAALREVRKGEAIALSGRWTTPPAGPLAARARFAEEEAKPGDVLLVRGDADLSALDLAGVAAVVASGVVSGTGDVAVGEGWDLSAVRSGLFVSTGAADAAIWF
jgi:predicted SnoaL-like aldol condensation-catalyzing enzyme